MKLPAEEPILQEDACHAVGLAFREKMVGGFTLGESDPKEGERRGIASNSSLALYVTVEIPDLRGFLANPHHCGALRGFAQFAPQEEVFEIKSGQIRLFERTNDPALKLMEYRLMLRQGTRDFCLTGEKQIRKGRLLHSWSETTTLHCRLHEGADPSATVMAAGVLHITLWEFLKQTSTFQATNAPSIAAKAAAVLRFLHFFGKELIDSYV